MLFFTNVPYILYLTAVFAILSTLIIVKFLIDKYNVDRETGRKILHFVAVMVCAFVVFQSNDKVSLAYIFFVFSVILFYIAQKNILLPSPRKSYGIAFFPLSFGILLLLDLSTESIIFGIITLGISDALAGLVGEHYAKVKHTFLYEKKSWLGFITFFLSTLLIGYFFLGFTPLLFILAIVPALSELFSFRGSDNFTVPLVTSIWFSILTGYQLLPSQWFVFILMMSMCITVYYKNWLSMSGTAAAILLGTIIIFSAGYVYLIPISIFFIVGSLTSKLNPTSKDASGRNAFQVFANGIVAVVLLLLYAFSKNDILLIAYFASIAISFADTLSSDIGIYYNHKTYDITTFKSIKSGLSGGISVVGTFAGILTSFGFAIASKMVFDLTYFEMTIIGLSGSVGMIVDSLMGSLWQAKYLVNNQITEEKNSGNILVKGLAWINNDGVNLLANIITVSLLILTIWHL